MPRKGPLLTLLAGAGLMAGLLIANVVVSADPDDDGELVGAAGDATPTVAPSPGVSGSPPPPGQSPPPPSQSPGAQGEAGEPTTYVGRDDDESTAVAIVIEPSGDEATAYVCDGVNEVWLTGPVEAGQLDLEGDGAELTATYDGEQASGETTLAGQELTFTIDFVEQPEGLFRVADTIIGGAEVEGGWIVLEDGTQIGVLTRDGESSSAPELNPETGEVDVGDATIVADRVG